MVTFVSGSSRNSSNAGSRGAGTTSTQKVGSRNSEHILVIYGAIVIGIVAILVILDVIISFVVR